MVCPSAGPTSPPRTSRSSPAHLAGIPHFVRLDSWGTARLGLSYRKNFIARVIEKKPLRECLGGGGEKDPPRRAEPHQSHPARPRSGEEALSTAAGRWRAWNV